MSQYVPVFYFDPPPNGQVLFKLVKVCFSKWQEMRCPCGNTTVLFMTQWLAIRKLIRFVSGSGDLLSDAKSKKNSWYYQCLKVCL